MSLLDNRSRRTQQLNAFFKTIRGGLNFFNFFNFDDIAKENRTTKNQTKKSEQPRRCCTLSTNDFIFVIAQNARAKTEFT